MHCNSYRSTYRHLETPWKEDYWREKKVKKDCMVEIAELCF